MAKKNYNTTEDFLLDESFNNWSKENRLTDVDFWDEWIAYNPNKKEVMNEAKDIILGLQFKNSEPCEEKTNADWVVLESIIKAKKIENQKKQAPNYFRFIGIAASILLLVSLGIYTLTGNPIKVVYKTAFGEVLNLKLKDGSSVTLNSNSSIYYYENDNRKVWLTGEAFFEVDKKETTNAKFWVITDDLNIEVYGTSFNVDTKYEKTAVFLEEGRIWLALKNGTTKKMIPGNYLSYSAKENRVLDEKNNLKSHLKTSWKDGSIIFEKLFLKDAIKKIEETYGVKSVFKDEESKYKIITGAVPITNLDICLKAIEKSVSVRIEKINNQLIIKNRTEN